MAGCWAAWWANTAEASGGWDMEDSIAGPEVLAAAVAAAAAAARFAAWRRLCGGSSFPESELATESDGTACCAEPCFARLELGGLEKKNSGVSRAEAVGAVRKGVVETKRNRRTKVVGPPLGKGEKAWKLSHCERASGCRTRRIGMDLKLGAAVTGRSILASSCPGSPSGGGNWPFFALFSSLCVPRN